MPAKTEASFEDNGAFMEIYLVMERNIFNNKTQQLANL